MGLQIVRQSVRRLRKRYVRSLRSMSWERRLRREIESALHEGSADLPLPDFLIIGAPKCATSWLQGALRQHPQVRIVPDEIEYFSSHVDRPLQWYLSHFEALAEEREMEKAGEGKRIMLGEKSAGYCGISPSRIKLVRGLLPDARLILMVRDPVARHWSHAKQYFSKEKSHRKGFDSLESRQKLYEFFMRTRRLSEFSKAIENWTKVYPPERFLVISQEVALADPVREFEKALHHINISNISGCEGLLRMKHVRRKDKNIGPVVPMPDDVKDYLERMFAEERKSLAGILKTYAASAPAPAEGARQEPIA